MNKKLFNYILIALIILGIALWWFVYEEPIKNSSKNKQNKTVNCQDNGVPGLCCQLHAKPGIICPG